MQAVLTDVPFQDERLHRIKRMAGSMTTGVTFSQIIDAFDLPKSISDEAGSPKDCSV
jgi:hypothetical protein